MQFKLFYLSTEAISIDAKLKAEVIKMFKLHNRLGWSSQKNLPKWHLAIEKNDKIETIINYQKNFNTS
jgi:hypothetical protein